MSADTATAQALHAAALDIIAARTASDQAALVRATSAFNALAGTNAQRIAAMKEAESADTGFFGGLTASLAQVGTLAKVGLVGAGLFLLVKSGILRNQLRPNPHRRRRARRRNPFGGCAKRA